MYVLIVGAVWVVWVGVCPHCGSSLGRCMYALIVGAVCPHCGSSLGSLGRCMLSLWEWFG